MLEIAVCWRRAAQILQVGMTLDNLVLKWWLAFLHTAPALRFISSLISSHVHLYLLSKASEIPFRHYKCAFQGLYSFSSLRCSSCNFPRMNWRYLIKVKTSDVNRTATAHCRRSRGAFQEPCTLELALSVLPIPGTEFTQYLQEGK